MKFNFIETLKGSLLQVVKRFPVTLSFVVAITVLLLEMIYHEDNHPILIYFLTAGCLLSLMLHLWGEEVKNKSLVWGVMAVTNVLLVIDSLWLNSQNLVDLHSSVYVARLSVYVAFLIGCVYMQFWKNKDDMESSNFGRHLLYNIAMSYVVCLVLTIGLLILYNGTLFLFGIGEIGEYYKENLVITVMIMVLLASIMILSRIPQGEKKHDSELDVTKFYRGVLHYMFIPLIMCYMVVLYIYLFKILLTRELPNGTLSTMVSFMMVGLSIVVIMLYPIINKGGNSYEKFASRWFPLLALPLVILMTVGIVRRLSDYGITANRLYVLTLNLWFYAVCIGLFISRSRRIHWISISFGALFLLSSAQPYNYGEIAHRVVRNRLNEALADCRPDSVFKYEYKFHTWLRAIPDTTKAKQIYEDMLYLYREDYHEDLDNIVSRDEIYIGYYNNPFNIEYASATVSYFDYYDEKSENYSKVKPGYEHVMSVYSNIECKKDEVILPNGRLHFDLDSTLSLPPTTFEIDTATVKKEYFIDAIDGKSTMHFYRLSVDVNSDQVRIFVRGFLFYNEPEE